MFDIRNFNFLHGVCAFRLENVSWIGSCQVLILPWNSDTNKRHAECSFIHCCFLDLPWLAFIVFFAKNLKRYILVATPHTDFLDLPQTSATVNGANSHMYANICVCMCVFFVCVCVCVFAFVTLCSVCAHAVMFFFYDHRVWFISSLHTTHTHKRTSISKCKKFTRMRVNLLPKFTRVFFTPQIYSHASKFSPQIYPHVRTLWIHSEFRQHKQLNSDWEIEWCCKTCSTV